MLGATLSQRRGRLKKDRRSLRLALLLQTLDSQWVVHEVDEARAYGIPIICVVDADRQLQREVIDHYMERGFGTSAIISPPNVFTRTVL